MKRRYFLSQAALAFAAPAPRRILIVAGPSSHPPGTHEVSAGARLLKHCVEHMTNVPGVQADLFYDWPTDAALLAAVRSVVFIGDIFPPMRLPDPPRILQSLGAMMARGCGITCLHYATGLRADDVAPDGEHPLLHWTGGYFATANRHHQSVAKVFPACTITPAALKHPIARGWKEFTVPEEPYYKNYFGPDGNKMAASVTALATSMLPPDAPRRETVAWCTERKDGGRGVSIVMPHFYRNWKSEDMRRFILNGVVWSAKLPVPRGGVQTASPDLEAFTPDSVDPKPRTPAKK